MPVIDFATKNLVTIENNATLLDAAKLMSERHVGCLVVVGSEDGAIRPMGMLTDRDIVLAAAEGMSLTLNRVDGAMTRTLVSLKADDGLIQATNVMAEQGIRRMPVVDHEGNLVGLITADDIYEILSTELENLSKVIHRQLSNERAIKDIVLAQEKKSESPASETSRDREAI